MALVESKKYVVIECKRCKGKGEKFLFSCMGVYPCELCDGNGYRKISVEEDL